MTPVYCFQFFLFSFCVNLFTIFSYFVYYSDRLYLNENIQQNYDYIIVGSGTAGSVIAHRLATETNYSFIVLEAGSRGHSMLEIPVLGPFLHRSVFDWQFESISQHEACLAMEGKICRLPQGKILGGSSKLNNMIHIRGNISHYSNWFHGKYSEQYIKSQFEDIENKLLTLSDIQYQSDLSNAVLLATKELGYDYITQDFKVGFMKAKLSQHKGKRWAISDNLLKKHILTNALVENVIFDGNTATGVNIELLGKKYKINASKGVILSAGAINTPKILQLSGIGPEHILKSINIPIVKVLPVGKNLQDHVATGLDLILFNKSMSINALDMLKPINVFNYFYNGIGPFTTPGCEIVGFVSTKNKNIPDLQFMVLPVGLSSDRGSLLRLNLGINDHTWQNYFAKVFDKYVATILPVVLHPKSKGCVYITSSDPKKSITFDPKYLSNKKDIETLISGLKIVKKLVETDALKSAGAYLNPLHFPGCESHIFFSDAYLKCYVKHLTLTSYHPIGTCSMGLPKSKTTVVDTSFRVLGVKRLYAVDASVLPTLPSGNINAAVAMMASIFFESNIKILPNNSDSQYCRRNILYESLLNICITR